MEATPWIVDRALPGRKLRTDNAPEPQRTGPMKPRISVITLAVSDLDRATRFYRDGLGLAIRDDKPPVVYFELEGTWLALFPREALASYANVASAGDGFGGITLSSNVDSIEEVDRTMNAAEQAGATIVNPAREVGWGGYTGWFKDLDGHLWEIVYNPRPFIP